MRYLVELYLPRRGHPHLGAWLHRAVMAAHEVGTAGAPVRCLGTVLLVHDETCFLRFEAPSAAAVEAALRRAGIEFERVLEAEEISV